VLKATVIRTLRIEERNIQTETDKWMGKGREAEIEK
jgi:hypothetical protein